MKVQRDCKAPIEALVIGASAGGLDALFRLLGNLPASYRLPIMVVQHMPPRGPSRLVEIFTQRTALQVSEAREKLHPQPGSLYFAPPGYHLLVEEDLSFSLSMDPRVHYSRPSIDVLFESAADAWGPRLAGALLTGANADGAAGLAAIAEAGGLTIVQDPAEAQAASMPRAALARMTPDYMLPLAGIHELLLELGT